MTQRFLVLFAEAEDRIPALDTRLGAIMAATGLPLRMSGRRHHVLASQDLQLVHSGQSETCILGQIFGGTPPERLTGLQPADEHRISLTSGQALIDDYWGAYVALIPDADGVRTHVVRDPSSGLACLITGGDGFTLLSSGADLLAQSGLLDIDIDWSGLADHLQYCQLRTPRTALAGITELLAGARWTTSSPHHRQDMLWHPWDCARLIALLRDPAEAAARLRHTVQQSISAWSRDADPCLLKLSGGLDSSILATALSTTGASFTCLNYYTRDQAGNERDYARAVATKVGRELVEVELSADSIDLFASDGGAFARPTVQAFQQAGTAAVVSTASAVGAHRLFNGAGGDNVFCYLHSARPVLDRLKLDPLGTWRTALDTSRLTQAGLGEIAAAAWRRRGRHGRRYQWHHDEMWPSDRWRNRAPFAHPWLSGPRSGLPGTAAHIANILQIQNHLDTAGSKYLPVLSPLLSQPIMELCLSIPSYLWCEGGRDRTVARRAFADLLPPAVVDRRSKGTPESLAAALYDRHRRKIRERLLDGRLVRQGLVDRTALERAIAETPIATGTRYSSILRLVDAEAWLALWPTGGTHPRASACAASARQR